MKALSVHVLGELPRLEDLPMPEAREGEVLVRVEAAVLGRHDVDVVRGRLAHHPPVPYVPGLEGAGRVVAIGAGVDPVRFPVGAPVRVYGGGLGANRPGTWAEFVTCPARSVTPMPEGLDAVLAAACGSVALTAMSALDLGGFAAGQRLGVTGGTGAVGSLVLQLARNRGAGGCVAWARSPDRAAALPPDTEVIFPGSEPPSERINLLVDTVGGGELVARLRSVRPGGCAVLIGYTAGSVVTFDIRDLLDGDVKLLPLNMRRRRQPDGLEAELLEEFARGRLSVATEVVGPDQVAEAFDRIDSGEATGRVVLRW